jgi:VWFA-related protein
MKSFRVVLACASVAALVVIVLPFAVAQQGPTPDSSETIARPRKKKPPVPPADSNPSTDSNTPADTSAPADSNSSVNPSAPNIPSDDSTTPAPEEPKIPSKFNRKDKEVPVGTPTFNSDVTTVELDVAVLDNKGHFLPGIPREDFRVLEDDVPQKVATFNMNSDAPMTIALVIEFSNLYQQYWSEGWYETLSATYGFVQTLKPEDYLAIVAYDLRTEILCDFTNDQGKIQDALQRLRIPGFSEANMFDALVDTAQRMSGIEGRKAILLIASGRDTFSKLTYDKTRKALQEAGVPVYTFSLMQAMRIMMEPYMGNIQQLDFLQADNEMKTFAAETGGQAFFPRFLQEYPSIFQSVGAALRNQYTITYRPSNQAKDGKFRKLKVELVDPKTGEALRIVENRHPVKYSIVSKSGYTAPRPVE